MFEKMSKSNADSAKETTPAATGTGIVEEEKKAESAATQG